LDILFRDASALVKRYVPVAGSKTVDALFGVFPTSSFHTTLWSYSETYSFLCRKRNDRKISDKFFHEVEARLDLELLNNTLIHFLSVDDRAVLSGLNLIRRHNLNSNDAVLLAVLLDSIPQMDLKDRLLLVTADKRLAHAAAVEGLRVLYPEDVTEDEIDSLFGSTGG
jgi:predicted nucleic acid-binding protein